MKTTAIYRVSPAVKSMFLRSRDQAHIHLLSAFPPGFQSSPRAAVGLLWNLQPTLNEVVIQSKDKPIHPELIGGLLQEHEVLLPKVGDRATFSIAIACLKTPMSDVPEDIRGSLKQVRGRAYRSKPVTVPEVERADWFMRRMRNIGLDVDPEEMDLSGLKSAVIAPNRGRIPYVDVVFTGTVNDEELLHRAQVGGVGKGKNYGLAYLRCLGLK